MYSLSYSIGKSAPRAIFGLSILVASLGHASVAAAEIISTRFEVYGFAGVPVLTLHSRIEEGGGNYGIAVDFATQGVARAFLSLSTHAQVQGRLVAGSAQPQSFQKSADRDGADRRSRLVYRPDGAIKIDSAPPPPDPVTPAEVRGTVDNLTAYFRLEKQLAHSGSCAMTQRVFDGRSRYDLVFTDAGRRKLTPSGGQNFAGDAIACHMTRYLRGGASDPESKEGASSGTIWYARLVSSDLMVPVRMTLETQLGTVHGYLAELHSQTVNLALME